MATVTKTILPPGVYHAPQGKLHATRQRLDRWAEQFRRMKAAGIRVPICWGHQPGAVPGDGADKATRQFALSRFNAGYLEDLRVGAEGLEGDMDIPGAEVDGEGNLLTWAQMPDGRKVRCAIREVSAAIRDWKDGRGREWPDVIMHVALVPLPVVAGQGGFSGAELGFDVEPAPGEVHLSLSNYLHERVELSGGAAMPLDDVGMVGGGVTDHVQECLGVLAQAGIHLPADTNEGNLCERISLVGGALLKHGVLGSGGRPAEDGGMGDLLETADDDLPDGEDMVSEDDLPLDDDGGGEFDDEFGGEDMGEDVGEDVGEDEFGGGGEFDEEDGATVEGDSDGIPGDEEEDDEASEEARPMMLGTGGGRGGLVARTPLEKQFVRQVRRGVKRQRLGRLKELVRRGMPQHKANQLRQEIESTPVELAMRGGKVTAMESRVDVELSTLEEASRGGWVSPRGKVARAKRPRVTEDGRVSDKFIEEQAASVSTARTRR